MKNMKKVVVMVLCILALGVTTLSYQQADAKVSAKSLKKRYVSLLKKCKKSQSKAINQSQMNVTSYKNYKLWDKELNYVYGVIKKSLSSKKASQLLNSERAWIKKRDEVAKKASAQYTGGTAYAMEYNTSLSTQTQKRIMWLINTYAK